jgi:ABC-2 type transport system permease protein
VLLIFRRLWQVSWAEQWQYRANLIMYLLYWLVSPVVYLAVWTTVANSQGSVSGLTANYFVTYYMTLLIVDQVTSEITIHIFPYKIQDGTLSSELIRPIHPLLTNTLVNTIAFKVLNIIVMVPVWGVLWIVFQPDFSAATGWGILLAVPAAILGFAINFLLAGTIACVAFWTTRVWALHEFYYALAILFSGQFVPLQLMPQFVQEIARYLPFAMFRFFPIQLVLGQLSAGEIIRGYLVGILWLAVAWFLFRRAWRAGVRQYSAVGA